MRARILFGFIVGLTLGGAYALGQANTGDGLIQSIRHEIVARWSRFGEPQLRTADNVPVNPKVMNPVGVNTFLEQEVDVELRRRTVAMIRAAGIGWIRQQFPWDNIEPVRKGQYIDRVVGVDTWQKYDAIVSLAEEFQLQLIVRLDTSPPWARPGNEWYASPPANLEDYADFVESVARRYRGRVRYYQIWNEPNLTSEWGNQPVDAAGYARLLRLAAQRIRAADPDALILSAAMAPTIEESSMALNELKYLDQMYQLGAASDFDILAVQAYGLRGGPDDRRVDTGDINFSRPRLVRQLMVDHGDSETPVWAMEVGWNAQPQTLAKPPIFGRVTEEVQARYTVRALERAREEWPWMGVMAIWFFKRADYNWLDDPMYYFRMTEPDLAPTPLYGAIQNYTRQRGLGPER